LAGIGVDPGFERFRALRQKYRQREDGDQADAGKHSIPFPLCG